MKLNQITPGTITIHQTVTELPSVQVMGSKFPQIQTDNFSVAYLFSLIQNIIC